MMVQIENSEAVSQLRLRSLVITVNPDSSSDAGSEDCRINGNQVLGNSLVSLIHKQYNNTSLNNVYAIR